MIETIVSLETAKLLKEKGFQERCRAYWHTTVGMSICMRGSLALTIKPEEKCAHIVEGFEPTESLLRRNSRRHTTRYCTLIKQYIKGSIPVECPLKEQ